MNSFTLKNKWTEEGKRFVASFSPEQWIVVISIFFAAIATVLSFSHGYVVAYGDAESHLNIAKRVVDSLTPGFAQLGGIWLPLPHIFLLPFVYFDPLWKSGIAGSVVSGIAFVISALYLYKLTLLITNHKFAAFLSAMVFVTNPSVLYMQSTPMTELTLIVFFILSSYYFILFLEDDKKIINLLFAAFFGFCASLSRYDGWALVLMEVGVLFLYYFPYKISLEGFIDTVFGLDTSTGRPKKKEVASGPVSWAKLEGRLVIFCTLALFGIILWLAWGWLILGDPLYFTHSQFSAKSQQSNWLLKGELPAYNHIGTAILYYFVTSMSSAGVVIFAVAIAGLFFFGFDKNKKYRSLVLLVLAVPFIFNVLTLFLGQSVIFIPSITPISFEWRLFNVRYGIMMVPFLAFCVGYAFYKSRTSVKWVIASLIVFQLFLYGIGYSKVIALEDGVRGLSSGIAKIPDAQGWLQTNYDGGMILTDDFARTVSLVRLPVKMHDVIYIGNKPYWEESLVAPEKYARWIVMQRNDTVWTNLYDNQVTQARLYKYFNKAYTSKDILIFKRISDN